MVSNLYLMYVSNFVLRHLCAYFHNKQNKSGCHIFFITWKAIFQRKFYKRLNKKHFYQVFI